MDGFGRVAGKGLRRAISPGDAQYSLRARTGGRPGRAYRASDLVRDRPRRVSRFAEGYRSGVSRADGKALPGDGGRPGERPRGSTRAPGDRGDRGESRLTATR